MFVADLQGSAAQALARRDALVASYRPLVDRVHAAEADAAAARAQVAADAERVEGAVAAQAAAAARAAELEGAEVARDTAEARVAELHAKVDEVRCPP